MTPLQHLLNPLLLLLLLLSWRPVAPLASS